jgi:hypothetical protein
MQGIIMANHKDYDENLLWAFIESVGLAKECEEFCKTKSKEALEKAKAEPIGDRTFNWEGHYSKYCYEISGEDFDDTAEFNYLIQDKGYIPISYVDPSSNDPGYNTIDENVEYISLREMEEISKIDFDEVLSRLIAFANGDLGEGDQNYYFDDYGFDVMPTKEQFKAWLEQLKFVKSEVDSEHGAADFFYESRF